MGNRVIAETGEERLMHRAFAALRRAVPQEWSIQVDETGATDRGLDAVLTVESPSGAVVKFAVEVKSMSRGAARDAVRQAEAISRQEGLPAVVLTDFANPALRNACLERRVGFIDETGWVSLRHDADPSMLVSLQGAQRVSPDRETAVMERLDGPGASKVIRALWEVTTFPTGVRELAEHAKVSPGTVAKMLPTLAQAGAVERSAAGAVIGRNRRLLLDRWTQDYSFTDSNRDVLWLLAPRGVAPLDQAIVRLPQSTMIVSTGSLGARNLLNGELLSVTPLTLWAYYTTDPKALADELGLRPTSRTAANVVLARPRDTNLLKTIGHGMVLAVPPVQVLADLMTMGGRFPDEAEQLFNVLYPNEPSIAQ